MTWKEMTVLKFEHESKIYYDGNTKSKKHTANIWWQF